MEYLASGCIRTTADALPERLLEIHQAITHLVEEYKPTGAAIEEVFVEKSSSSALKLGTRGAALVALYLRQVSLVLHMRHVR